MRLFFLLAALIPFTCFAQPRLDRHFSYKLYTTYDGLAQSQVNCMMQDSKGYLWIGTKGGLSRYDGESFQNFVDENDASRVNVIKIIEIDEGFLLSSSFKIWKFTYEEENPSNWKFEDIAYPEDYLFHSIDFHFYNPPDSCLYLFNAAKQDYGAVTRDHIRFNLVTHQTDVLPIQHKEIKFKAKREGGPILFTSDSAYVFDNQVGKRIKLPGSFDAFVSDPSDSSILAYSNKHQKLFRLTDDFSQALVINHDPLPFLCNEPLHLVMTRSGTLFSITPECQIVSYGNNRVSPIEKVTMVKTMLIDRDNNLWVGTENGIYNFFQSGFEQYKFNIGQSVDNVWSIVALPDRSIWFGGFLTGFWSLNQNGRLRVFETKPYLGQTNNNFYMGGITDNKGRGFLPVVSGMLKIEKDKIDYINLNFKGVPMSMTDDTIQNRLLIGASGGFISLEKDSWKILDYVPLQRSIVSTCIDREGNILAGTFTQQFVYQPGKLLPHHARQSRGVISMTRDYKGNIWKGTSVGLYLDNGTTEEQQFQGSIKGVIAAVHIKHPWLLAATVNKLFMVNLDTFYTNPPGKIYEFDSGNGYIAMDGGQNGFCTDYEGYVWYTVTDKVLRFSPGEVAKNYTQYTPKPHFSSFLFSSDQITWHRVATNNPDALVRPWYENSVRLAMKAVSMGNANKMVYQYRIKKLSPDWSEPTGITQQTFSNLRPGKYQIEIRCSCHEGIWSESVTSPIITIKHAWWQYWWVQVIVALVLIGIIYFLSLRFIKKRQEQQIRKLTEQKRLNELRLQSVRSKHVPHFSGNALANIEHFIFSADIRTANKYLSKYSRLMNITLRDADRASRTVGEELEYVTIYLELEKMRFGDQFEYELQVDPQVDRNKEIPNMLLQTWVENALKHGLRHYQGIGKVVVLIEKSGEYTKITVQDNGVGRAKAKELGTSGTGSGLRILTEQIEIYNHFNPRKAEMSIQDLTDRDGGAAGTRIGMSIPEGYNFDMPDGKPSKK